MLKKSIVILSLITFIGCTPNIVDRDFEKEERDYIKQHGVKAEQDPLYAEPSQANMLAGEEDGIRVNMSRGADDVDDDGQTLQTWYAVAYNKNDESKCFAIQWKLMDFEMITDHTTFVYIKPHQSIMDYAKFKQKVWDLDGIKLVLPASGYIDTIFVRDPTEKNDCEFIETDVVDEK